MTLLYPIGITAAIEHAVNFLKRDKLQIIDHPSPEVTHLLLDIPSFRSDGMLRSGDDLKKILETLPPSITIVGGNLKHPLLTGYRHWDFLLDEFYLAQNAAITADCALQIASPMLNTTLSHSPALIIGWGRIGKCLGNLLHSIGCDVTIAARKASDLAMLRALGYKAIHPSDLQNCCSYRIIFNTAPDVALTDAQLASNKACVKIDLASKRGLPTEDTVWARGLPGIHAPESSGRLIADTFLKKQKEVCK